MFKWKKIFFVVVIILVVIILQARNINVEGPFRGLLGNIVNPAIYYTNKLFVGASNIWSSYINLVGVKKQNDEYRNIIEDLTLKNNLLVEKLSQSETLETLIHFYKPYYFRQLPANVIGTTDGYIKTIIIDLGSLDGIEKNDPVIGFQGLVGKVSTVYATTSEVDVLLNVSSSVSVINNRTRVAGIMHGDGKGRLYIDYYDRLDSVRIGDVFITSGLGRLFPKGVRVGKVSEIIKDNAGLFQKVYIEQSEDYYNLEYVFVAKDYQK